MWRPNANRGARLAPKGKNRQHVSFALQHDRHHPQLQQVEDPWLCPEVPQAEAEGVAARGILGWPDCSVPRLTRR